MDKFSLKDLVKEEIETPAPKTTLWEPISVETKEPVNEFSSKTSRIGSLSDLNEDLKETKTVVKSGWTPIVQKVEEKTVNVLPSAKPSNGFKGLKDVYKEELINVVNASPTVIYEKIELPPPVEYKKSAEEERDELVQSFTTQIEEQEKSRAVKPPEPIVETIVEAKIEPITESIKEETLIDKASAYIASQPKNEETFQQPVAITPANFSEVARKVKFLEEWIGKVSMAGPGSGSYWLYDLGDTNYNIVKNPSNDDVLTYNAANAKWEVNNVTSLLGTRYHGSYYSMATQTANITSTPYFVRIETTDFQEGFTTDGANVIATYSGVYNLQFSLQLHHTGGGGSGDHVEIWLNKNGIDQANTNTIIHVNSGTPYVVAAWNFLIPLSAGEKVALRWGSLNTNIKIESNGHVIGPAVPSVIATITSV